MTLYGISNGLLSYQHHWLIIQGCDSVPTCVSLKKRIQPLSCSLSTIQSSLCRNTKWGERLEVSVGRRLLVLSFSGILLSLDPAFSRFLIFSRALASPQLELDRYTDAKEGFTLLVPSSWIKVDKAGATLLFEDGNKKSNNMGVVVSPTRISGLKEFGTPHFVADKLIQAEKRKESTKAAEVISISERSGQTGVQVYEFEYKVDSTRGGMKRVFSAAFAISKKLYLLNIIHSDGTENPLDTEKRMILEQVLHSFDSIPLT